MGRPREKNISKWGHWKRNQRDKPKGGRCRNCGKSASDWAHKGGKSGHGGGGAVMKLCRSCHTKIDNRAGLHRKK